MTIRSVMCLTLALAAGCFGSSGGSTMPVMAARCRIGASQTSLLVTEWPAAEKANLEALLPRGAVAVEFSGCAMKVVPECRLPGRYSWARTTSGTDIVEIKSEEDLYAKLPLGAISLSGELKQAGTLYVETTVAGQMRLEGMNATDVPSTHECARATHLVSALSLGAFILSAGRESGSSVDVGVHGIGAGRNASQSVKVVRYAGNPDVCGAAAGEAPPVECASPIQAFLSPIPGRAEAEGPPGSVKVDFVSSSETVRWDVYVDDEATCTTPCARWVDPSRPLVLRARDLPDRLSVSQLEPGGGPVQIAAEPKARGRLATGIVFTSLGGLAIITGISLTGVGCSQDDEEGMCNAGLITGGAGALVTVGGIYLMLDARARLRVRPLFAGRDVVVGPGFVAGRF